MPQKIELIRDYVQHYRRIASKDPTALNRKVPREAFAELLDRVGALLIKESAKLAISDGPIRTFMDANPLPSSMASSLPVEFRAFCLALNSLKQWVAAEQAATDRYLLGGAAKQICREASDRCLVTGETLGKNAELHHPIRDGRPAVLLSKAGHQSIEGQLSLSGEDKVEKVLRALRKQNHQSWAQLRRGCVELLGSASIVKSKGSASNARTFARNAATLTNLTYEGIIAWLEKKGR